MTVSLPVPQGNPAASKTGESHLSVDLRSNCSRRLRWARGLSDLSVLAPGGYQPGYRVRWAREKGGLDNLRDLMLLNRDSISCYVGGLELSGPRSIWVFSSHPECLDRCSQGRSGLWVFRCRASRWNAWMWWDPARVDRRRLRLPWIGHCKQHGRTPIDHRVPLCAHWNLFFQILR